MQLHTIGPGGHDKPLVCALNVHKMDLHLIPLPWESGIQRDEALETVLFCYWRLQNASLFMYFASKHLSRLSICRFSLLSALGASVSNESKIVLNFGFYAYY